MKIKLQWILWVAVLFACKPQNEKAVTVDETAEAQLPAEFNAFLEEFGSDSLFQLNHIIFPLDGERALNDGEKPGNTAVKWERDSWKFQRTFNDMGGSFRQEFVNFNGIITEVSHDHTATYVMTRRFSKIGGEWMLIYYQEMGLH